MAKLTRITNTSNQLVGVSCSSIDLKFSSSSVDPLYNGVLQIAPKSTILVEDSRLDRGQIQNLANFGLISFTTNYLPTSYVTTNSPPINSVSPHIIGEFNINKTLTANIGVWIGQPSPTYSYQWYRDGVLIVGEIGPTYTITPSDLGKKISVKIVASNQLGINTIVVSIEQPPQSLNAVGSVSYDSPSETVGLNAIGSNAGDGEILNLIRYTLVRSDSNRTIVIEADPATPTTYTITDNSVVSLTDNDIFGDINNLSFIANYSSNDFWGDWTVDLLVMDSSNNTVMTRIGE